MLKDVFLFVIGGNVVGVMPILNGNLDGIYVRDGVILFRPSYLMMIYTFVENVLVQRK